MKKDGCVGDLLDYLGSSPTAAHAVSQAVERLEENGFVRIRECDHWELDPGDRFYVIRSSSSLIAGIKGLDDCSSRGFRVVGAHTDFPGFRVKPCPDRSADNMGVMAVEVYGGPILGSWFDRDLSIAGTLAVTAGDGIERVMFDLGEPVCRMATPALHLSKDMNKEGFRVNPEKDTPLIFSADGTTFDDLLERICAESGSDPSAVAGWSLEVYDPQPPVIGGLGGDLIFSGRLDNLAMCHAALQALIDTKPSPCTSLICLFNNEEVGSGTLNGAGSRFMDSVLERLAGSRENYFRSISASVQISADGAHGLHPNFKGKHDPGCRPLLNGGPVIKVNAQQRYTSNDITSGYFRTCASICGVEVQQFVSRNDMPCGSTIGPVTSSRTGILSVDAGNPMLSMHSVREMAGTLDHQRMIDVMKVHLTGRVSLRE